MKAPLLVSRANKSVIRRSSISPGHAHWAFFFILLLLTSLIGLGLAVDTQRLAEAFKSISVQLIGILLVLSMVNYAVRALRWVILSEILDGKLSFFHNVIIYFAGFSMTLTPGRVGEVFRLYLLKRTFKISVHKSAILLVGDRFHDLMAVVIVLLISSLMVSSVTVYPVLIILAAGLCFAFVVVTFYPNILHRMILNVYRFLGVKPRLFVNLRRFVGMLPELIRARRFFTPFLLSIVGWFAEGFGLWLLLHNFGVNVSIPTAVFIFTLSMLAGVFAFLPGGIGSVEAVLIALLLQLGVDLPTAVVITTICRIVTLWFGVLVGILALPVTLKLPLKR